MSLSVKPQQNFLETGKHLYERGEKFILTFVHSWKANGAIPVSHIFFKIDIQVVFIMFEIMPDFENVQSKTLASITENSYFCNLRKIFNSKFSVLIKSEKLFIALGNSE